ncbi:MAG: amidohydrolase family protein [Myxococcota bacterium]|nr:amidohydrolase family protein [Myxococcota bacterium]
MYDIVIRDGFVVDGSGAEGRVIDIGIKGGRIAALGEVGSGRREVDARGLLVTPGFVDVHTHYDAQVTWDEKIDPSSGHGCTTVVMGNCGVGFAPVKADQRDWLIGLMEGVEDIPGAALSEGIKWDWESFPEYIDSIEKLHRTIDFATQVPHGAVRGYVMGERGANNEDATAEDIAKMAAMVKDGIKAGALGFSTSRTPLHKAIDGRYVPGTFAAQDELRAIADAMRAAGPSIFQVACDHTTVPADLNWMESLSKDLDLEVMFNLSQIDQAPQLWTEGLSRLRAANQSGAKIKAQVAGRAIGIVMGLRATAHPFALLPSWLQLMHRPWAEQWAALNDPAFRTRLLTEEPVFVGEFETFVTTSFNKMYPLVAGYEPRPDDSIAAIAASTGRTCRAVALEHLLESNGQGQLYFPLFNYSQGDLDVLFNLHQDPDTLIGLSDAGAHCGAICDGGMPTFMLTHWARDRERGSKLPLEWVIHRQTQQTAEAYGLRDRGLIREGYRADLNVIDFDNLTLNQPRMHWDLPAGGRRLLQKATGYVATICAGQFIVENDAYTGALPGRLIKGRQSAPRSAV